MMITAAVGFTAFRTQLPEDPLHRVRVRRHQGAERVPAGTAGGQHLRRSMVSPRRHVLEGRVPRQHRRRAQASTHGSECRTPRVPRIRHQPEALQQVPARRSPQRAGQQDQLPGGFPSQRRKRACDTEEKATGLP
jgi:hypothetical protein